MSQTSGYNLKNDELLVTSLGSARLRMDLDKVPLWRGDHVTIRQLVEDFGRYLYLPRVRDPEVLLGAIRSGFSLLTWERTRSLMPKATTREREGIEVCEVGSKLRLSTPTRRVCL
jgi:hypothetical protein